MRFAIFGLTVSSSWGNGHATLWRGLLRALARRGHDLVFFEKDVPFYAEHRDLAAIDGFELLLYRDWDEVQSRAARAASACDVAIVTSYCPDALDATALVSDEWEGLDRFFEPGREILVARTPEHVVQALARPPEEALAIGLAARRRVLAEHTADPPRRRARGDPPRGGRPRGIPPRRRGFRGPRCMTTWGAMTRRYAR